MCYKGVSPTLDVTRLVYKKSEKLFFFCGSYDFQKENKRGNCFTCFRYSLMNLQTDKEHVIFIIFEVGRTIPSLNKRFVTHKYLFRRTLLFRDQPDHTD